MTKIYEPSSFFEDNIKKRELLRDLREGEEALKAKASEYIPRFPAEDNEVYNIRVKNSYLYNVVDINIQKISAKPFSRPASINTENLTLKSFEFNFDQADHTITEFAKSWFEDSLWDAQSHVFVDYPVGQQREDGSFISSDSLPVCVILNNDNILQAEYNNGEVTYLRFLEEKTIRNGFNQKTLKVVKIFEKINSIVYFNIFTQDETDSDLYIPEFEEYKVFGLNYIPLVSLYPMSTRIPFKPKLIFQNMAYIQKAHFKTLSDKRNLEQIVMVPFLFGTGLDTDATKGIAISAFNAWIATDANAKLSYVEHNGAALNTATVSLNEMVDQMETIALDLVSRSGGNQTATQSTIDQANNNTLMSCMAVALKEGLEKILDIYRDWLNISEEYSVDLVTKFDIRLSADEINFLNNAVVIGALSNEDYFNEGKRRGVINSDLTYSETMEKINNQLDIQIDLSNQ